MTSAECRAARVLANLSQQELARLAGVVRRTVVRFENGETGLNAAASAQIGQALGKSGVRMEARDGLFGISVASATLGTLRKAARVMLGMSQDDLADAASLGRRALVAYEAAESPGDTRRSTAVLVDAALRERGIVFFEEEGRVGLLGPAAEATGVRA